jgi:hypothetical protein
MSEGLQTPDGKPVEVTERDFDRAMAAPVQDEPTAPSPPRKPAESREAPKRTRTRHDAPRSAKTATAVKETPDQAAKRRKDGVKGIVQISAGGAAMAYQSTGNKAWLADSVTLTSYAEPLADAVADAAAVSESFAQAVDRIAQVGPYGALVTVTLGLGVQLAANHGVKAAQSLGAQDPAELIASLESESEPEAA